MTKDSGAGTVRTLGAIKKLSIRIIKKLFGYGSHCSCPLVQYFDRKDLYLGRYLSRQVNEVVPLSLT